MADTHTGTPTWAHPQGHTQTGTPTWANTHMDTVLLLHSGGASVEAISYKSGAPPKYWQADQIGLSKEQ